MNWRDYTTITVIVIVAIGLIATLLGVNALQMGDWRIASGFIALLGLLVYLVMTPRFLPEQPGWYATGVFLGVLAIILTIPAIVINNKYLFMLLGSDLVILWIVATVGHIGLEQQHRHHHAK